MKIFICGPDGSGKSTLAQKLSHELALPVFKGSVDDPNKQHNLEIILFNRNDLICDRFYALDDEVYSDFLDIKPEITLTTNILTELKKHMIIYVDWTPNILLERIRKRGDEYIKDNIFNIIYLQERYTKFFKDYDIKPIIFTNTKTEDIIEEIKRRIENDN